MIPHSLVREIEMNLSHFIDEAPAPFIIAVRSLDFRHGRQIFTMRDRLLQIDLQKLGYLAHGIVRFFDNVFVAQFEWPRACVRYETLPISYLFHN
jgi:hypothetical protein